MSSGTNVEAIPTEPKDERAKNLCEGQYVDEEAIMNVTGRIRDGGKVCIINCTRKS